MKKNLIALLIIIGLGVLLVSISPFGFLAKSIAPPPDASSQQLQIITSFRPFTLLVAPIVGTNAQITQLLPPGADPHDYEPTPKDVITLQHGQVFFYDGPFLEPWASSIAASANPNITLVSFADAVPDHVLAQMKHDYPNFPDTSQDPHLWLSPKLAQYFVPYAAQKLSSADPDHAANYTANAQAFQAQLQTLDDKFTNGLSNCTTRTFLTSHAFLNYVAASYNLTAISIAGLSPDAEPSIQQIDAIIQEAKTEHVMGILAEPGETQQLSRSVGSELNLTVYPFSTLEILPSDRANGSDYISVQEHNLQQLKLVLGCE